MTNFKGSTYCAVVPLMARVLEPSNLFGLYQIPDLILVS